MLTVIAVSFLALGAAWVIFAALLHLTQDKREPAAVGISIPFLEPVIGYARHKIKYFQNLQDKHQLPIYTLRMPFARVYVVSRPSLINALQRQSNAVSFGPVGRDFGFLFSGLSVQSQKIIRSAYDDGGNKLAKNMHDFLRDGPFLCHASQSTVKGLSSTVPKWGYHGLPQPLLGTVRHALTIAFTDTIYGPRNPYRDPEVEAAWLDFLPGISHIVSSPLASFTARRHFNARGKVVAAFMRYFESGGHLQAPQMLQNMYATNKSHGLSIRECAKMEIATSLAVLSSGSLTAFWFTLHILSSQSILKDVRAEIFANLARAPSSSCLIIDASRIKATCPTLKSVLEETLRYHSTVVSPKFVSRDVLLADTYLLKANSLVLIPGPNLHYDTANWGADANTFNHYRFLGVKKNISTACYRPFGSGESVCPGKQLSTNVILSLVVMLVVLFDIVPTDGEWVFPTTKGADAWNAMPKPDHDVSVEITPRRETHGVDVKFIWDAY